MYEFPTIDEIFNMLEEISQEVPKALYDSLNAGLILSEDLKYHKESRPEEPLYVLGEYRQDLMGRSIYIYYGSLRESFKYESLDTIHARLKEVLYHEFIHHVEELAGERDLKQEDAIFLEEYRRGIDRD